MRGRKRSRVNSLAWLALGFMFSHATLALGQEVAARDRTLKQIIDNVKANEKRYRNIEVRTRRAYRLGKPMDLKPGFVVISDATSRHLLQQGMFYYECDESLQTVGGQRDRRDTIQGFDGITTKILNQKTVAEIRNGRVEDAHLLRPHSMLLAECAGVHFALSIFLIGGNELKATPWFRDAAVSVRYDGDEVENGLRCHRLRVDYPRDRLNDGLGPDVRYIWLSPERNYLPVRTEYYRRPKRENDPPLEVGWTDEFREISPGVWFPFRYSAVVYDVTSYDRKGTLVVSNIRQLFVDSAKLDPHYDVRLFRDIPISDGVTVQVIENGKVVKKYTQGRPRTLPPELTGWLP
jgi:hypothetical protein